MKVKYGVIGGSGLYQMEGARLIEEVDIPTPFGMPSDVISILEIEGIQVAFLPRHGRGHRLLPTEVPSKANIWALKSLGVQQILSISAVGSLKESYKPGDFVICDQIIDRTKSRDNSYFGEGIVGHVAYADPFCNCANEVLLKALEGGPVTVHPKATIVVMEGPLFSTKAESHLYRSWKADIIGMTALPEAKLAREAEICFSCIGMVTDYDCWHEEEESVSVDMVLKVMAQNTGHAKTLLPTLLKAFEQKESCQCSGAAQFAVMTKPELIPYETRRKLALFYKKYWD